MDNMDTRDPGSLWVRRTPSGTPRRAAAIDNSKIVGSITRRGDSERSASSVSMQGYKTARNKIPEKENRKQNQKRGKKQVLSRHHFVIVIASVVAAASCQAPVVHAVRQKQSFLTATMASGDRAASPSSALKELKDTVWKQQAEIKMLKAKLNQKSPTSPSGGTSAGVTAPAPIGHGNIAEASPEEVAEYLNTSFVRVSLGRVGWLGLFLMSLSMTAVIMNSFEHTLEKQLELAYFVPMLAGHGGNTGGQAVGTVLSALSAKKVKISDAPKVIMKEGMAGVLSGCILGCAVCPIAHYIMGISTHVSTVLLFTMPLVSTVAATLGSTIPFICVLFGLDPSVIAAPAMTSFVDVTGLISYFLIANYIFGLFGVEL